jgi:arylsulfatase A-like enzyme
MIFTDMHAGASWCVPSRYALMTATYPHRNSKDWHKEAVIGADEMTLPLMLRANGYETCMIGKWHLGFNTGMNFHEDILTGGPCDRGFDEFFGLPHSLDIPPYLYIKNKQALMKPTEKIGDRFPEDDKWTKIQGEFWRKGEVAANFKHNEVLDTLADKAAAKIKSHSKLSKKPLFLYVPLTAPHTPWLPAERFVKSSTNGLYGAFIAHVDDCVAKIERALEESGMKENTIVVITSDNGPVWYEKDIERTGHKSTGVMRGMKGDVHEGGHRVPFILRWPSKVVAGSKSASLAGFIDMIPTFADVVGDKEHGKKFKDGFSLFETLKGGGTQREVLFHLGTGNTLAVRSKNWKYIPFNGSGGFTKPRFVKAKKGEPTGQLYNLATDVGEQENVLLKYPELVKELQSKILRVKK